MPKKNRKRVEFVENPSVDQFVLMVESHDPTHIWSENDIEVEEGQRMRGIIDKARDFLGDEVAVRVWNSMVRRKIVPSMVDEFLWSMRKHSSVS